MIQSTLKFLNIRYYGQNDWLKTFVPKVNFPLLVLKLGVSESTCFFLRGPGGGGHEVHGRVTCSGTAKFT